MSTQVTVTLTDDAYERASRYAAYANRDLSEIIAAALASSLPSIDAIDELQGISKLPDRAVLALTKLRMEPEADRRLSELLEQQQRGDLGDLERAELAALMRNYEIGLLRQSQALVEAVRRALIPPLTP
jgi:hypothetical protein